MPKYKLVEMTDLRNTGKRRVYPKMVVNRTLSQSEFIDKMKMYSRALRFQHDRSSGVGCARYARASAFHGLQCNASDELGTFSLSLDFEDDKPREIQDDSDKMIYRKVGVKSVNFKPSPQLVKDTKLATDCDPERDMSGVKRDSQGNLYPGTAHRPSLEALSMRMVSSVSPTMPISIT